MAPMTFIVAAMRSAARGVHARVDTEVTIIKLKDIVQGLESCADAFEELANVIESLALKES